MTPSLPRKEGDGTKGNVRRGREVDEREGKGMEREPDPVSTPGLPPGRKEKEVDGEYKRGRYKKQGGGKERNPDANPAPLHQECRRVPCASRADLPGRIPFEHYLWTILSFPFSSGAQRR